MNGTPTSTKGLPRVQLNTRTDMKSVVVATERQISARILEVKKDPNCTVMKSKARIEFRGEKLTVSDEMKECFLKLSDMVPEVPFNEDGNIDGTVLMQYVIDYILDLELQLDGHITYSPSLSSSHQSKYSPDLTIREPLSEKTIDNIVSTTQIPQSHCQSCTDEPLFKALSNIDNRSPSK